MLTNEAIPFWTALAALAATGSAVMAAIYTFLTFRLVQVQAEPKVIVYVKHDLERPSVLMIIIENIGRDIAYDVSFKASKPIPYKAWGIEPPEGQTIKFMHDGPLIEGIPSLGPRDTREITWGQYGGLSKALEDKPVTLDYTYRAAKKQITGRAKLEVRSFVGTNAAGKPSVQIARNLKDLAGSVSRAQTLLETLVASQARVAEHEAEASPGQSTEPK